MSFSSFFLLANYSRKVSVGLAKEEMELFGRLVYHWRAGPFKMDPKLLHMHVSRRSHGNAAVNISFL